jgi:hypothetical protein
MFESTDQQNQQTARLPATKNRMYESTKFGLYNQQQWDINYACILIMHVY